MTVEEQPVSATAVAQSAAEISAPRDRPTVSIIMANYNCEAYLRDSIASILAQSFQDFELIVVDDASTDTSIEILRDIAHADARLRVVFSETNRGPAAARNQALDLAQGEWIAVADSDDLAHHSRFSGMLAAAARTGADIVADNLLVFDNAGLDTPKLLLDWSAERTIDLPTYLISNRLDGTQVCLGLLKPMFRASLLGKAHLRYNETLLNAEDADLVYHMLAQGARMVVLPEAWYLYRKHGQSISRRLTAPKLTSMMVATDQFRRQYTSLSKEALAAVDTLSRSYRIALDFVGLVAAAKARKPGNAFAAIRSSPYVVVQFAQLVLRRLNVLQVRRKKAQAGGLSGRPTMLLDKGKHLS